MAVSVPKRIHRRAVDRNLLKRRIREAYRYQKPELNRFLNDRQLSCDMVIQFRGRELSDFRTIGDSLEIALGKLRQRLDQASTDNGPSSQAL